MHTRLAVAAFGALFLVVGHSHADDFALKDGDTAVFLGDSITAARTYGKIIENYTVLRFPERKVRFINAGFGGDTAAGGLKRLQRDVFDQGATVVIVAYGVNDIGWGLHADPDHEKTYLDAVAKIAERCRTNQVRMFLCSAAITSEDPDKAEQGFLQQMCDKGLAAAKSRGAGTVDVQRTMRSIQRRVLDWNKAQKDAKGRETLHVADGVHLNDLGQLAMAFAILKGLNAPADVSSVEISRDGVAGVISGCKVTNVEATDSGLSFTRLDQGLPLNLGIFFALNYRFVPIPDQLNRYLLKVNGLGAGRYGITVDGRALGVFGHRAMSDGVNLCSATADPWQPGGPWNVQSNMLQLLTDSRHQLALGMLQARHYQFDPASHLAKQAKEADVLIEQMQREAARPRPYRFVIRKVD